MDMPAPPPSPPLTLPTDCAGVGDVLRLVGDKWTVQIVVLLHHAPRRFNAIKRDVPGISQQMLTRTLRALQRDGLVERTVHATTPPQVVYALTALGRSLADPVQALARWAMDHRGAIHGSRLGSRHDAG